MLEARVRVTVCASFFAFLSQLEGVNIAMNAG